jgi:hypothetical protein
VNSCEPRAVHDNFFHITTVLPVFVDIVNSNTGRNSDIMTPVMTTLPGIARGIHTTSLVMEAFGNFLRATSVAFDSMVPGMVTREVNIGHQDTVRAEAAAHRRVRAARTAA